jgi:hypothetical protein
MLQLLHEEGLVDCSLWSPNRALHFAPLEYIGRREEFIRQKTTVKDMKFRKSHTGMKVELHPKPK